MKNKMVTFFCTAIFFFMACNKQKMTHPAVSLPLSRTLEPDKVNLSDKLYYYWDGADDAPITNAVGFVLDQIKDEQGRYLNDEHPVAYRVKDEAGIVLHSATQNVVFSTIAASNIQGRGSLRIRFTDFLKNGQEGYFQVDFDIKSPNGSRVIAQTSTFIFVLKNKSKLNMDSHFLALSDAQLRRLVVDINPKSLPLANGNYVFYYKIGDAPVQSQNVEVEQHRAVIYTPQMNALDANDPNLRAYVWYKSSAQESHFSEIATRSKDFCTTRDAQSTLVQKYQLQNEVEYKQNGDRKIVYRVGTRNEEKVYSSKINEVFKVTDHFTFSEWDNFSVLLQKGFQGSGAKIGLNGKYLPQKFRVLPQELFCFKDQIQEINLNHHGFDDTFRHQDLAFFKNLQTVKLAVHRFSAAKQQQIQTALAGKLVIFQEDTNQTPYNLENGACWMIFHNNRQNGSQAWMLWAGTYVTGTKDSTPENNSCPFTYLNGNGPRPRLYDPVKRI